MAKPNPSRVREEMRVEYVPLEEVIRWPRNPKGHDAGALHGSFKRFGFVSPLILDEASGRLVAGHGRLETLEAMQKAHQAPPKRVRVEEGRWMVPVIRGVSFASEDEAMAYLLADNRMVYLGGWDEQALADMLGQLAAQGEEAWKGTGFEPDDLQALLARLAAGGSQSQPGGGAQSRVQEESRRTLAERFGVPPFSVLDARQGYWQDRKRAWIGLGIDSELGRGENLLSFSDTVLGHGKEGGSPTPFSGTSIFDPVLCELAYRWFCPDGGSVFDPFAGGSVRGVVAGMLGRSYIGLDLRMEQVEANRAQAGRIFAEGQPAPRWAVADARELGAMPEIEPFDLLFTCPPYFDLERYSEDQRDLSAAKSYAAFLDDLGGILKAAVAKLKPNRFAALVLGEIRDKQSGFYRGLVPDAVGLMEEAGASFYNEAVLVTSVSSLPIRIGAQFGSYRKLGKCHQNLLVFFKGDWKKVPEILASTEWGDLGLPQTEGDPGFIPDEEP